MLLRYNNDEEAFKSAAEYLCKMSDYSYKVSGRKLYQQYKQELTKLYALKTLFENAGAGAEFSGTQILKTQNFYASLPKKIGRHIIAGKLIHKNVII